MKSVSESMERLSQLAAFGESVLKEAKAMGLLRRKRRRLQSSAPARPSRSNAAPRARKQTKAEKLAAVDDKA